MEILFSYFSFLIFVYGTEYLYYFLNPVFDNEKLGTLNNEYDDL